MTCLMCGASGPVGNNREEAIAAWNRRAQPDTRLVEAVREFMEGRGGRTHLGSLTMRGMSCPDHCEACKVQRVLPALRAQKEGK